MGQHFEKHKHADSGKHRARGKGDDVAFGQIGGHQFDGIAGCSRGRTIGENHFGAIYDAGFDMH